jgi:putative endopeptidase
MKTKTNKPSSLSKTKKCRPSKAELKQLCQVHANTYNRFEEEYSKTLNKKENDIEAKLIKLFKTPFTPTKYREQDDYYTYINYQWLEDKKKELTKKAKYFVQVDSFRITQDKVYNELIVIIKEYIKNNKNKRAKAIKDVYESLYNLDDKSAENYVKFYVDVINQINEKNNIYELLASLNINEIFSWGSPIVWSVMKDAKNVDVFRSHISAPVLTIYDYTIYIEDTEEDQEKQQYKRTFKRHYFEFINTMFDLCLGKGHEYKAEDVWQCEYEMLSALGCDSIKKDDLDGYNVLTQNESVKECNFDWSIFAKELGYTKVPDKFICLSKNYLKCMMNTLALDDAWKTKKWTAYFLYIGLRQIMRFHNKWRFVHYEFFEKFIKGQPLPYPKEIYPIFGMSFCFNTFLTNEYIDKYNNPQAIDYVHNMASDLLTVYKRIIHRNTWLSKKTKKFALLKLEHIKLIVGSPKLLRDDPILDYNNKEAMHNMRKLAYWRAKQFMSLDGKSSDVDIPTIDWNQFKIVGKQSYVVNAYYTPSENSIYVPLGYLQTPFIDLAERGIEYNLAFIGYTLGHEMSHCLDDTGSKYDYKGNLYNWWTKEDRHKFELKVKDVIKQYETFAMYDGIKMDASLSTGENLADISGLAICEEYLRDFQEKNDDITPIRALSFHAFFIYIAIQSRQQIFKKAVAAQLKTNPHPMDKYRTNCPLSRLQLFRSVYNIKKKDKMYWPSMDTIW